MALSTSPLLILVLWTTFLAMASAQQYKQTQMSVYFQDFTSGPNITTLPIAGIARKLWSWDQFATLFVTDNPITEGPSPNSALVGRAQAIDVIAALNGRNALVLPSIVFTNKTYNGSTIEIQGTSKQLEPVRELAVISGTGKFRFARGYATFETITVDQARGYAVVRCNITIQHY